MSPLSGNLVGFVGGEALQRPQPLCGNYTWRHQRVHVIWHNNIRMESIPPEAAVPGPQCRHYPIQHPRFDPSLRTPDRWPPILPVQTSGWRGSSHTNGRLQTAVCQARPSAAGAFRIASRYCGPMVIQALRNVRGKPPKRRLQHPAALCWWGSTPRSPSPSPPRYPRSGCRRSLPDKRRARW